MKSQPFFLICKQKKWRWFVVSTHNSFSQMPFQTAACRQAMYFILISKYKIFVQKVKVIRYPINAFLIHVLYQLHLSKMLNRHWIRLLISNIYIHWHSYKMVFHVVSFVCIKSQTRFIQKYVYIANQKSTQIIVCVMSDFLTDKMDKNLSVNVILRRNFTRIILCLFNLFNKT